MLYLVGLGLSDETDITVKGLEIVKKASRVYLEAYTSILLVEKEILEKYYGREVILADREMVESSSDDILHDAQNVDVAFLVVGDPFGATTHTDLVLRARTLQIPIQTIPNASIMSAIGSTGLQLYNFGQTVSMVFFTETWKPASFHDRIRENRDIGLHTLVLLDIKVKEQSLENMARGRMIYEPPRYMTVGQCAQQMLEVEEIKSAEGEGAGVYGPESLAVGAARVGGRTEKFVSGTLKELCDADDVLGGPLHSLVLLGRRTHELESECSAGAYATMLSTAILPLLWILHSSIAFAKRGTNVAVFIVMCITNTYPGIGFICLPKRTPNSRWRLTFSALLDLWLTKLRRTPATDGGRVMG
ncbi:Tetrapyrrole methylase [Glarea lozoyensis ATCC 20868]|uniref:Diphthine methyl ester synthase n=1 Tax=Glarea lozoyensis (strain ATCC 20868 / MF5171) TaxID=1116229 RepID=S3DYJ0_GLAL2|nr:Tetrapyrrole methylase [Glarea lozoyensis ATCC 20868]EPE31423.1 Tetrapyrrole methylase [Glarea lozoyensis ATCC 20868]